MDFQVYIYDSDWVNSVPPKSFLENPIMNRSFIVNLSVKFVSMGSSVWRMWSVLYINKYFQSFLHNYFPQQSFINPFWEQYKDSFSSFHEYMLS